MLDLFRFLESVFVCFSLFGASPIQKDLSKILEDVCLDFDLIDIWRVRNPDKRLFIWKQTRPLIQRRLDYWLISDVCQDKVEEAKIIPSMKSDHLAITFKYKQRLSLTLL